VEREQIGACTLYMGDCREVLPTLGEVDAVITDPPYGVNMPYASFSDTLEHVRALITTTMPLLLPFAPIALTPGCRAMWFYPPPTSLLIWIHPAATSSGPWGFQGVNPILVYGRDPWLTAGLGRRQDHVVMASDREGVTQHPCVKPLPVWRWLVQRLSPRHGQTILDPFTGSGTTGVACVQLGRTFVGIEIEPRYFDLACQRITDAYAQPDLFVPQPVRPQQQDLFAGGHA